MWGKTSDKTKAVEVALVLVFMILSATTNLEAIPVSNHFSHSSHQPHPRTSYKDPVPQRAIVATG